MSDTDTAPEKVEERSPAAASPPAAPASTAVTPAANAPPAAQPASAATTLSVAPPPAQGLCLDCGAKLEGKYCVACGQRGQVRSLSMPSLIHDAIHDFGDFDSRVWITVRALLFRPGFLTNEFIHGRRTRYMPPFRLYLVLSVVFFVALSFKPTDDALVIDTGEFGKPAAGVVTGADPESLSKAMEELNRELAADSSVDPKKAEAARKAAKAAIQAAANPDAGMMAGAECQDMTWDAPGKEWFEPRLRSVCEHLKDVPKRQFGRELVRNVPKMMFLFLPLLAFVNLVLYAFRRRRYVEHLLFYVHFHAFAFLLLTLLVLVGLIAGWLGVGFVGSLAGFAAFIYLFVALYKSMRTVYGQGHLLTTLKYLVVLMAYGIFSLMTLVGTIFYTALTV